MVHQSSRVLRKLSGELTIIQYCEDRPSERPDLRLRFGRAGLAGGSAPGSLGDRTSAATAFSPGSDSLISSLMVGKVRANRPDRVLPARRGGWPGISVAGCGWAYVIWPRSKVHRFG